MPYGNLLTSANTTGLCDDRGDRKREAEQNAGAIIGHHDAKNLEIVALARKTFGNGICEVAGQSFIPYSQGARIPQEPKGQQLEAGVKANGFPC